MLQTNYVLLSLKYPCAGDDEIHLLGDPAGDSV